MMKRFHLIVAALVWSVSLALASDPTGVWATQDGESHVRVAQCGKAFCGNIVWVKNPIDAETGKISTDKFNPDPAKRNRRMLGIQIAVDMKPSGTPGKWSGHFYNADDGQTYEGSLILGGPGILYAEGCLAAFCMRQIWTKVK
ncbi:MAG TPA: DUF2147 domain-containing protein [Xanthobacteraceae bacterium]|jgi:uncharacterized protein (DUF2147 family)|nr:DUF2147 domain-containing protein [Xanthobacteraceae bacterium]